MFEERIKEILKQPIYANYHHLDEAQEGLAKAIKQITLLAKKTALEEKLALLDRVEKEVVGENKHEGEQLVNLSITKNLLRNEQRAALKEIRKEIK